MSGTGPLAAAPGRTSHAKPADRVSTDKAGEGGIPAPGAPKSANPPRASAGRSRSKEAPPKRIKREQTQELFPSLAVQNKTQDKLMRLANSISGYVKDPITGNIVQDRR